MKDAGSALMGIRLWTRWVSCDEMQPVLLSKSITSNSLSWVLVVSFSNITGGHDLSMFEVDGSCSCHHCSVWSRCKYHLWCDSWSSFEEGEIKITVVATGFDESQVTIRKDGPSAPRPASSSSFGRRVLGSQPAEAALQQKKSPTDDLDIPAFLRNENNSAICL